MLLVQYGVIAITKYITSFRVLITCSQLSYELLLASQSTITDFKVCTLYGSANSSSYPNYFIKYELLVDLQAVNPLLLGHLS